MYQKSFDNIIRKLLNAELPHLKLPAVVLASVVTVRELPETFEQKVVYDDETGISRTGRITSHWQEYTLTVLDRFGNPDESFPPLPRVRSEKQFPAGSKVAVGLLYGELNPVIIGEALV